MDKLIFITGASSGDKASAPSHVSISEVTVQATNQPSPQMFYRK